MIACVALLVAGGGGDLGRTVELSSEQAPALAVLGAAIIAYYSFVGFETSANVAEEAVNPSRTYPRALFGGLAVAGVVVAVDRRERGAAVQCHGSTPPVCSSRLWPSLPRSAGAVSWDVRGRPAAGAAAKACAR